MAAKGILAIVLALAVAAIAFGPFMTAVTDATAAKHVGNESLTADIGTWQQLDENGLVGDSETVWGFNETSGDFEEATAGDDYEFNYSHGRIKPLNESTLIDGGEEYKVSYDWKYARGHTAFLLENLPLVVALIMMVLAGSAAGRHV